MPANDRAYRDAHQARSAELVTTWLLAHRANPALIREVAGLVRVHEWGGSPAADLLQAADSISFLETTALHAGNWIREGRYTRERTEEQLRYAAMDVDKIIRKYPEVVNAVLTVGGRQGEKNKAEFYVFLKPFGERKISTIDFKEQIRKALKDHGATCPDPTGQPTQHPTARWVFHSCVGIHV